MRPALLASLAAFVFVLLSNLSCDNKLDPGIAEVKVIDEDGVAQKGVKVILFCVDKPTCVVREEGRTNDLGVFETEFELPVVLRVRSVRYDSTETVSGTPPFEVTTYKVDSLCGEGYIQIENEETTSETITILDCNS